MQHAELGQTHKVSSDPHLPCCIRYVGRSFRYTVLCAEHITHAYTHTRTHFAAVRMCSGQCQRPSLTNSEWKVLATRIKREHSVALTKPPALFMIHAQRAQTPSGARFSFSLLLLVSHRFSSNR